MARAFISLSKWILVQSFKYSYPRIVRVLIFFLWTEVIALASIWRGMIFVTQQLTTTWRDRVIDEIGDSAWDIRLYYFFLPFAWATIILGWVALSFTTVFILRWIF